MELISFFNYKRKANTSKTLQLDKEGVLALINENRLSIYRAARGILKDEEKGETSFDNIEQGKI